MKDLVVYTCVTGGYDSPSRPSALPGWADWVLLTEKDFTDNRYPKLLPHKALEGYDYSLWLDGNVDIVSDLFWDRIRALMDSGCLYAGIIHPQRDCVYEESVRILSNDREGMLPLLRTVRFLRSEGFPAHAGLNENNVILRRHCDPQVVRMDELWWEMYRKFSRRDQMTWSYCMWKTGLESVPVLPPGSDVRNHPFFRYTPHGKPYRKNLFKDALRRVKVFVYTRLVH